MTLRDIVFGNKRDICCIEQTMVGGIIFPIIKMNSYEVYIYGAGRDISSIVLYFWSCGVEIKGIIDSDINKNGKIILDKVPVIHPNYMKKCNSERTFIIINTVYFSGLEQQKIIKILNEIGVDKFYALNDYDKWQMKAQSYEWTDSQRIDYYRENIEKLEENYELLYDQESKKIMMEYIRSYVQLSIYKLEEIDGAVKYFYGKKIGNRYEELYEHLENEVWINCGSAIGDNIFQYFALGFNADLVCAYEADKQSYRELCNNLEYLPEQYRVKVKAVNAFIDENTDFKSAIEDKRVTLINADIEGGELNLIRSMHQVIKRDRPVLAICAYHKASDLTELIQYIKENVDDYVYILRKYMASFGSSNRTAELVLYAIPKERLLL